MNYHQQEELRSQLVEAGFLDSNAQCDPTKSWAGLEELIDRLQKRLAEGVCLFVYPHRSQPSYLVVLSHKQDKDLVIGLGDDVSEAICRAALTLHGLFAQHPQYAAFTDNAAIF